MAFWCGCVAFFSLSFITERHLTVTSRCCLRSTFRICHVLHLPAGRHVRSAVQWSSLTPKYVTIQSLLTRLIYVVESFQVKVNWINGHIKPKLLLFIIYINCSVCRAESIAHHFELNFSWRNEWVRRPIRPRPHETRVRVAGVLNAHKEIRNTLWFSINF